ncbi:hypothetical protein GYMLUDRAFT_639924 [Collybiopsis luxurians FD-317 M1]|nr:hypothetical protein GYMLUDRAFT_639924 [Collybiopsis luxurians FD-317 M1]
MLEFQTISSTNYGRPKRKLMTASELLFGAKACDYCYLAKRQCSAKNGESPCSNCKRLRFSCQYQRQNIYGNAPEVDAKKVRALLEKSFCTTNELACRQYGKGSSRRRTRNSRQKKADGDSPVPPFETIRMDTCNATPRQTYRLIERRILPALSKSTLNQARSPKDSDKGPELPPLRYCPDVEEECRRESLPSFASMFTTRQLPD